MDESTDLNSEKHLDFFEAMADFKAMFPMLDDDIIEAVLRSNAGAVDDTIDQLLAMTTIDPLTTITMETNYTLTTAAMESKDTLEIVPTATACIACKGNRKSNVANAGNCATKFSQDTGGSFQSLECDNSLVLIRDKTCNKATKPHYSLMNKLNYKDSGDGFCRTAPRYTKDLQISLLTNSESSPPPLPPKYSPSKSPKSPPRRSPPSPPNSDNLSSMMTCRRNDLCGFLTNAREESLMGQQISTGSREVSQIGLHKSSNSNEDSLMDLQKFTKSNGDGRIDTGLDKCRMLTLLSDDFLRLDCDNTGESFTDIKATAANTLTNHRATAGTAVSSKLNQESIRFLSTQVPVSVPQCTSCRARLGWLQCGRCQAPHAIVGPNNKGCTSSGLQNVGYCDVRHQQQFQLNQQQQQKKEQQQPSTSCCSLRNKTQQQKHPFDDNCARLGCNSAKLQNKCGSKSQLRLASSLVINKQQQLRQIQRNEGSSQGQLQLVDARQNKPSKQLKDNAADRQLLCCTVGRKLAGCCNMKQQLIDSAAIRQQLNRPIEGKQMDRSIEGQQLSRAVEGRAIEGQQLGRAIEGQHLSETETQSKQLLEQQKHFLKEQREQLRVLSSETLRRRLDETEREIEEHERDTESVLQVARERQQILRDERLALLLQNEEFLAELRLDSDFMSTLNQEHSTLASLGTVSRSQADVSDCVTAVFIETTGGKRSDDLVDLQKQLKSIGDVSRNRLLALAHKFLSRCKKKSLRNHVLTECMAPSTVNLLDDEAEPDDNSDSLMRS